jgi:tripartite-type tricarboxylate transporter receptor subunit TctC
VARPVFDHVSRQIGQTIVYETRPGAGGTLGMAAVAKAEPDGYTLLLGQSGPISINPAVYKSLPYDPLKDLAPVTMTTSYPYILVVNSDLAAGTLQEFVALARSKPGTLNYGSTGVGAANHLVAELFNRRASLEMTHVPYRGTALAVGDLLAGQLTMVFGDPISVLGHIKAGKLRALAVTSLERSPIAPEIPTVAESGYPDFEALAWHGILAPAKTPANVIETLNREFVKAVRDPETKALLANQAMQPVGSSPDSFAAFIKRDIATWKGVAELARVTVE